jgi:uncharacterized protein YecE (DUF72 family)
MEIFIGCSGFYYKDWKSRFYPEKLPQNQWLQYYSTHFNTVEINNTFYSYPKEKIIQQWADKTPEDFSFSIKGHRFFSHLKRLDMDDATLGKLDEFQSTIHILSDKLGCVLWQLPGSFSVDISRFEIFCKSLDHRMRHVVEFRHLSWFNESIYDLMRQYAVSYCMLSAPKDLPETILATTRTAYLRFHGKSTWYNYLYSHEELLVWKERLKQLENLDRLYVFFNNDTHAYAIRNATTLKELYHV